MVFVLSKNKKPLNPCHPAKARRLLKQGKAVIHKKYPFTIRLKYKVDPTKNDPDYRLKIDPGAKTISLKITKSFGWLNFIIKRILKRNWRREDPFEEQEETAKPVTENQDF
jgi:hypothetical protein